MATLAKLSGLRVRNLLLDRRMLVTWFPTQLIDAMTRRDYEAGTLSGSYTGSLTIFDLDFEYTVGANELLVFSGGVYQIPGGDYVEMDNNTFVFVNPRTVGEVVSVIKMGGISEFSGYKIFRATSPEGEYKEVGQVGKETSQFIDQVPATFGVAFFYKVLAFKGSDIGDLDEISPVTDTSIDTFEDRPFLMPSITANDMVVDEAVIGVQDDSNKTFTTKGPFRANTLVLKLNGLHQAKGSTNTFVEDGLQAFKFNDSVTPPTATDILRVQYLKL